MESPKTVKLPSGVELAITPAPFKEAKALYQAVMEEMKHLKMEPDAKVDINFIKDLYCTGFSSKRIEDALAVCMKRVLYNGMKIDDDTFEPIAAREDYVDVCHEVLKENVNPFLKSLYAQFGLAWDKLHKGPA